IPTNSPKNDFTLKVPTMEGIHLLYLEINKIFSLSCQPICNSAYQEVSAILLVILGMVTLVDTFSSFLRRKFK
ncbi:hypothetical protein, partial [Acinetobacter baumannii]|uniref:hypothetical protein n=1 Tax=Acinetobacter baumannii TaxID=470 RepID=UPI003CC80866